MQINSFQPKRTTPNGGLSLAGMGVTLAISAFPDDANAAVQGSAEPQDIAASHTPGLVQTLTIPVDIDEDGSTEFNLVGYIDSGSSEVYVRLEPVEAGASVVGSQVFPFLADKLAGNASIDAGSDYASSFANLAWSETKGDHGSWVPVTQRGFVGVAFDFQGNTHYGSVDVEVSKFTAKYQDPSSEFDATLHGFVWETTPDTAILAGAAPALPPPASVPVGSFMLSLTLFAGLCLLGFRRLRQQTN